MKTKFLYRLNITVVAVGLAVNAQHGLQSTKLVS